MQILLPHYIYVHVQEQTEFRDVNFADSICTSFTCHDFQINIMLKIV